MWWYLYNSASRRLLSETSILPDVLPAGVEVLRRVERVPPELMWDAATATFVPRPPKVVGNRIDDMLADPELREALIVGPTQLATLRRVITRHSAPNSARYNPEAPGEKP